MSDGGRSKRAWKLCAEWLAYCVRIGWSRGQLDALEALWWEHHDGRTGAIREALTVGAKVNEEEG